MILPEKPADDDRLQTLIAHCDAYIDNYLGDFDDDPHADPVGEFNPYLVKALATELSSSRSELLTLRAERDEARGHAATLLRTAQEDLVLMQETAATVTSLRERAEAAEAQLARQGEALKDIAAERQRQIEVEGWTPEHDDAHTGGEMAHAAACYALGRTELRLAGVTEHFWPWDRSWWKPKDRESDLIRAGALIAAELDRLRRARSTLSPEDSHG